MFRGWRRHALFCMSAIQTTTGVGIHNPRSEARAYRRIADITNGCVRHPAPHRRRTPRCVFYGVTRKFTLLVNVPCGVFTLTLSVVAPVGTVVVIKELKTTLRAKTAVPSKLNAGGAGQTSTENLNWRSHLAGGRLCFHERTKPHAQAEQSATAEAITTVSPASARCPVEGPVGGLHQPGVGVGAVMAAKGLRKRFACMIS